MARPKDSLCGCERAEECVRTRGSGAVLPLLPLRLLLGVDFLPSPPAPD
jgi:hypothetical protein